MRTSPRRISERRRSREAMGVSFRRLWTSRPSLGRPRPGDDTAQGRGAAALRDRERVEYDRLVDRGVFEGEPLELLGGQLVVAETKGAYHSSAVSSAEYALRAALPKGWIVPSRRRHHPRGSNHALFAERRDLRLRVAQAREHRVRVLTQARRRSFDAWAAVGELECGHRHGDRALDPVDLLMLVEHAARRELGIGQRLGKPSHAAGGNVARLEVLLPLVGRALLDDLLELFGLLVVQLLALVVARLRSEVRPADRRGAPVLIGFTSGVPVMAIMPDVAWMSWSYAVCGPRGPSCPNAVIEQ